MIIRNQDILENDWFFLTFGAGSFPLRRAAKRISRSAKSSGIFNECWAYTDKNLQKDYTDFWQTHSDFILENPKGFGHWLWKPFLIREKLRALPKGSGLFYLDAGCHLNFENQESFKRFNDYLELAKVNKFLSMQTFDGEFNLADLSEKAWSRKVVTDSFKLSNSNLQSGQIQAGILFIIQNEDNLNTLSLWLEKCTQNNYEFLRDSEVNEVNYSNFISHRHDQAVFSAIAKTHGLFRIPDETFWHPQWEQAGKNFPIWAMRNKSGINVHNPDRHDFLDRVHNKMANNISLQKIKLLLKPFLGNN